MLILNKKIFYRYVVIIFTIFYVPFSYNLFADDISYYIYDLPGKNVVNMINNAGEINNTYTYDVFGRIVQNNQQIENSFKYNGEYYDNEAGLIYLRNRYYDPEVGRFITKDISAGYLKDTQSQNLFLFCQNNPVVYVDPNGDELIGAVAGGIVGAGWGAGSTFVGDLIRGGWSSGSTYFANITGGAVSGALGGLTLNPLIAGAAGGAASNTIKQVFAAKNAAEHEKTYNWDVGSYITDVAFSAAFSGLDKALVPAVRGAKPELLETMLVGAHAQAKYFGKFQSDILEAGIAAIGTKGGLSDRINEGFNNLINLGSNIYASPAIFSGSFGGVSLSKTALLLTDLSEIKGAFYDEKTGQIILVGKQNMSLPQMKLDDLAVAVNSVYSGQDPGVSIDPPLVDNNYSVRYDGRTKDTEFGSIMFEADRVMKTLAVGKDNLTGQSVTSNVTGYKSLLTRFKEAGRLPEGATDLVWRFWFKPKEVKLVKSADGNSMVFDTVSMELLTESKYQDGVIGDPQSEAFAANLTQYYDDYANERPIYKDLKRLGQVVSIVKWIKDNDIPIDLSFISNYQVSAYATPTNTPRITNSTQWEEGGITYTLTVGGGVTYTKPNEYLADNLTNPITDPLKQLAIAQRPAETNFKWNFTSVQNESLTAVAESLARARKDGNFKFSSNDLSYPADCLFPLEFTRFYDSFYDKVSAFGLGWEYRPFQIRFPERKQNFTFGSNNLVLSFYAQIFVINRIKAQEDAYILLGIDSSNLPLYAKNETDLNLLREISDGTFILSKRDNTRVIFDNQGNLISTADKNDKSINYSYEKGKLSAINAGASGSINISYSADRIVSVTGPGPRTIRYNFDERGNLIKVTNAQDQSINYGYDSDHRITEITDAKENVVFDGSYDDYNRLVAQKINQELGFGRSFSLAQRKTVETDPNQNNLTKLYDDRYRVVERSDQTGNRINISYAGDTGPAAIIDSKGAKTQYAYTVHGNVSVITKPDNSQLKLYYDINDNLVAKRDGMGIDTAYGYDDKNRMVKIYHSATLSIDPSGTSLSWQYDPADTTSFDYDPANGHLLSITDAEGRKQVFGGYNSSGIPQIIKSASGFTLNNAYDGLSRLKSISDPAGNSISFGYTDSDQIKSITTQAGTSNFYYDKNDNLTLLKDAKENQTVFNYDLKNNLQDVTDPEGGLTSYGYDKFNNLQEVVLPNKTKLGYEFDELNRVVLTKSGGGVPAAVIAILKDNLDLGSAMVGYSLVKALTVYNLGTKELTVQDTYCSDNFSVDLKSTIIPKGGNATFNITFRPQLEGQIPGWLKIENNDPDSPLVTVKLTGRGSLESIMPTAGSGKNGLQVSWRPYGNLTGSFHHYAVYRSSTAITDLSGLSPIVTITDKNTTRYIDQTAKPGQDYYYSVITFDASGNRISALGSAGPFSLLDLGRLGNPVNIDSAYNESGSAVAYNSNRKEYLLVYEANPSGSANNYDIFGQRISNTGEKIGSPFAVFDTSNNERNPQLAYNSVNNEYMVVVETDFSGNGTQYHAVGQRSSATGERIGSWFYLTQTTTQERKPRIAYNPLNNNYALAMEYDKNGDGSRQNIIRTIISPDGNIINYNGFSSADNNLQLYAPNVIYNSVRNEYLYVFELTNIAGNTNNIYCSRVDANNNAIGEVLSLSFTGKKNFLPELAYNPDKDDYICIWQYDKNSDGRAFGLSLVRVSGVGNINTLKTYSIPDKNATLPEICYFTGHDEFFVSFTTNKIGTSEFDLEAQRISATSMDFITPLTQLISVANSSAIEKNNCLAYNPDTKGFLCVFENVNTGGSNSDLKLQRIGALSLDLRINPASLDFGAVETTKNLQVINSVSALILLTSSSSQPWLVITPPSINTSQLTADFTVTVSRSGLSPAGYAGDVLISYNGEVLRVPVTMTVIAQPPQSPSNPSPSDGAVNQRDLGPELTVTMSWLCFDPDAGDTLVYDLYFSAERDKVANLDTSCLIKSNQGQSSYKSGILQYHKAYYWRIKAKDTHGLETNGPVWSFTTAGIFSPQLIPYTPDPTNNRRPVLLWGKVEGAAKYHLQVSAESTFSSFIVNDVNITSATYALISDLPEGRIYWRVSAIDNLGNESEFSASDDFTVQTMPPAIPVLTAYSPNRTKEQKPSLIWQAVKDAASYHIQISNASDFNNLILDKYLTTTGYMSENNLPEGLIYWRVSSRDLAGNESAFSDYSVFRIDITAPEKITGLIATAASAKITLNWSPFENIDEDFSHFNIYRSNSVITNVSSMVPISEAVTNFSVTAFIDTAVEQGAKYYYAITAEDILGNENKSVIGSGPVTLENQPLVLMPIGNKTVNEGELLEFTISATAAANENLIYSVSSLPAGAYFNSKSRLFSWLPNYNQQGEYTVRFEVTDGSLKDSEDVKIVVNDIGVRGASGSSVDIKLKVRVVQ